MASEQGVQVEQGLGVSVGVEMEMALVHMEVMTTRKVTFFLLLSFPEVPQRRM